MLAGLPGGSPGPGTETGWLGCFLVILVALIAGGLVVGMAFYAASWIGGAP
jgi:hypothetical protein